MMQKVFHFLKRVARLEDIFLITQDLQVWDRQFKEGKWDRLLKDQPNTVTVAEHVQNILSQKKALRVVDVGCGNGALARLLTFPGITYVGIDISAEAIAIAKTQAPHARFEIGSVDTPPLDIAPIDVLVCNEVLYYVHPRKTLEAYRASMAVDGVVVISIVRTWRSSVLWRRIGQLLIVDRKKRVTSGGEVSWDIAEARFK